MSANNFGGKTKNIPIPEVVSPQTDNSTPQEAPKPKELSKSQESLKNFILAFLVGAATFLPVWFIMINFVNIPMPRFIHISLEDWNFWISLLGSLLVAGLVLLTANAMAEEKNKWTEGISWVLIIIFTCWVIGYYGHFRKVQEPNEDNISWADHCLDNNKNPFKDYLPDHIFTLDRGEESLWVDFKPGQRMNTWGNHQYYKIIFKDGSVFTVDGNNGVRNLPKISQKTQVRFESLSDGQTIYVYLFNI